MNNIHVFCLLAILLLGVFACRPSPLEDASGPSLEFSDGTQFDIGAALSDFETAPDGSERSASIQANSFGVEGHFTITSHIDPDYEVRTLSLTATRDVEVSNLVFLEATIAEAEIIGQVDGSVLRSGNAFMAIEHPLAKIEITAGERVRFYLPRGNTLKAGQTWTFSFVEGLTAEHQFRRGFLRYLESRRAHPYRPFVHYNSWYDLNIDRPDNRMTETECLDVLQHIGRELTVERGVTLDAFVWDDGWDDHHSLWKFHDGFPNGFKPLRDAAGPFRAGMGVWMSPWGGYGDPKQRRIAHGVAQGYEVNEGGFSMAGPKYGAAFRNQCFEMMEEHGVVFFKFDGMGSGNTASGASGEAADDIDAVLELTRVLRQKNPEVFISATVGTWPSPFWLLYVDSIWRQGEDTGFAGVGSGREQWITYKDGHTHEHIVRQAPSFPVNNLMNGGLVIGPRANPGKMEVEQVSVRHEIRSMIGSGTCLQELYITPRLLTAPMWDDLAESLTWLRARQSAFADVHWVGGDPLALEVYGWGGWAVEEGYGVLTLRNPSDQKAVYSLDIVQALDVPPHSLRSPYLLSSPYAEQSIQTRSAGPTELVELRLEPFEVLSFNVVVAPEAEPFEYERYRRWREE